MITGDPMSNADDNDQPDGHNIPNLPELTPTQAGIIGAVLDKLLGFFKTTDWRRIVLAFFAMMMLVVTLTFGWLSFKNPDAVLELFKKPAPVAEKTSETSKTEEKPESDLDHVSASLTQNYEEAKAIAPVMAILLVQAKASSVGWVRYHNGVVGANNFSFARKSMVQAVTLPGVSNPQENVQNLQATGDLDQLVAHVKGRCRYDNITTSTPYYGNYFKNGNKSIFTCPVFVDNIKNPIGYIVVMYQTPPLRGEDDTSYSKAEKVKRDRLETYIRETTIQVSSIIASDHIVIPETV